MQHNVGRSVINCDCDSDLFQRTWQLHDHHQHQSRQHDYLQSIQAHRTVLVEVIVDVFGIYAFDPTLRTIISTDFRNRLQQLWRSPYLLRARFTRFHCRANILSLATLHLQELLDLRSLYIHQSNVFDQYHAHAQYVLQALHHSLCHLETVARLWHMVIAADLKEI